MSRQLKTYFLITITSLFVFAFDANSQLTSSPYTMYGLGSIMNNSTGANNGMGNTGIAFTSRFSMNLMNPASYNGLDTLTTVYELGIFGKYTSYNAARKNKQGLMDANLKYITMGIRLNRYIVGCFGFTPYSSVGYKINTTDGVGGTYSEFTKTFSGEGGINQVFAGGSVKVTKNLYLGMNLKYMFGNLTHTEYSDDFDYSITNITYLSNFYTDFGLQYFITKPEWGYNFGLTYKNGKRLMTDNVRTIVTSYEAEAEEFRIDDYQIPQTIGLGFAVERRFFQAGIDYEFQNWDKVTYDQLYCKTRNSNRYSFGVQLASPGDRRGTYKMIYYRLGAEYNQTYMVINGTPVNYRAITIGAGFPLQGRVSAINCSLDLGVNGTGQNGLTQELSLMLHIDMSLRDQWFKKREYN